MFEGGSGRENLTAEELQERIEERIEKLKKGGYSRDLEEREFRFKCDPYYSYEDDEYEEY